MVIAVITVLAGVAYNAGVPVEMHLYAEGGHAFGVRSTRFPIAGWTQLAETWLRTMGMIST